MVSKSGSAEVIGGCLGVILLLAFIVAIQVAIGFGLWWGMGLFGWPVLWKQIGIAVYVVLCLTNTRVNHS